MLDLQARAVRTLAGSGVKGSADGDAKEAQFSHPGDVALSADGAVLYVADGGNGAPRGAFTRSHCMGGTSSIAGCMPQARAQWPPGPAAAPPHAGRLRAIMLQLDSLDKPTAADVGTIAGAAATLEARGEAASAAKQ